MRSKTIGKTKKHKKLNVGKTLKEKGKRIRKIWEKAANDANLRLSTQGILPLSAFKIENENWPLIITFFTQEMLKKKINVWSNIPQT